MDIGKIPENVLRRSVLKKIKATRPEILVGADIGEDCAVFALSADEVFVISTDPITGTADDIGKLGIHVTVNDLAAAGAEPVGVMLSLLLPPKTSEEELSLIMSQVQSECDALGIQVAGGHTEVTNAVNRPVITVTGIGKTKKNHSIRTAGAKPGAQVVISKWAGLEGTSIIAKARDAQLKMSLHPQIVDTAKDFDRYLSILPESRIALTHHVIAMHDVTEGGVFGALWEMADCAGLGISADLKKIPLRQETIEICNVFDINPYELISGGSLLMVTFEGHQLAAALNEAGINAAVIGEMNDTKDRIIAYDAKTRYLTPPHADELYKVMNEESL